MITNAKNGELFQFNREGIQAPTRCGVYSGQLRLNSQFPADYQKNTEVPEAPALPSPLTLPKAFFQICDRFNVTENVQT
jgi:hypothetical protein